MAIALTHTQTSLLKRETQMEAESRGVTEPGSCRRKGMREPSMGARKQGWGWLAKSWGGGSIAPSPMTAAQSPNTPELVQ